MGTLQKFGAVFSLCLLLSACSLGSGGSSGGSGHSTPPPGTSQLLIYNCNVDRRPVTIWVFDSASRSWEQHQRMAAQYNGSGCGSEYGAQPARVTFAAKRAYAVVAVDTNLTGCDGDNPANAACQRWAAEIRGDPDGRTQTVTIT